MSVRDARSGIRVAYSNRVERLVELLADALEDGGGIDRIFEPPRVVVPNRNVEKYLKFELANRFGIVGDVAFSTLEAWLRDELPAEVEPLEQETLTSALVGVLTNESLLTGDVMEPVRAYLEPETGGDGARALRAYQLAKRLARTFREYAHSRTRMLDQWMETDELYTSISRTGRDPASGQYLDNERWQRRIWRGLFGEGGILDRATDRDRDYQLFTEYWRTFDPEGREELRGTVYLFGLSHVAPVYGQIFERLARRVNLRFFVLNPCAAFWENVVYESDEEIVESLERADDDEFVHLGLHERHAAMPPDAPLEPREFDPEGPSDAPLSLSVWGRAGRDHVHMLNRLTGYAFEEHWVDPAEEPEGEEPTLLEAFQSDVLRFVQSSDSRHDPAPDDSVRFIEAPGLRRELEAVADEIWRLVFDNDDLAFNDIAVIVNPRRREAYQMHLEAVFEEARGIPFNLVDVERGDGSRMLQAVELLLELPLGEFDRRELGSLLVHPNVTANYEEADPEEWVQWCDELGIYRGADADDLAETHVERDLYNWDQGIKRMVLGSFLEGTSRRGGPVEPVEMGSEAYLPASDEMMDPASIGRWIALVRELIGEARATRDHETSLGGWMHWMADWIEEHLAPAGAGEEAELSGYLHALRSAARQDLSALAGEGPVPYRTAVEFARDQLASQQFERGHYLATGVVVSSFVPQRPIPFEAIFMTGLSAEDFPGSSPRAPIDLRTAEWEEGDLWDRDRERYMFFETLLSARRRVTCSWVARNPVTGDDLEPSAVVREFQYILGHYLESEEVEGEGGDESDPVEALVDRHPLRRFDEAYFREGERDGEARSLAPTYHPSARAERRAERLREGLLEATGIERTRDFDIRNLIEALKEPVDLEEVFGLITELERSGEEPVDDEDAGRELPIRAVRKFLASPLQGWARYRLGLREDEQEALLEETDEPFELSRLDRALILRSAFEEAAGDGELDDIGGALRAELSRAVLEGRAPTGLFERVAEGKLGTVAECWGRQLAADHPSEPCRYRFGAPEGEEDVRACDALRLEVEDEEGERAMLDLTGETGLVDASRDAVYVPIRRERSRLDWRRVLRGWVQGLVLSASDEVGAFRGESFDVVVLDEQRDEHPLRIRFDGNDPSAARGWLESLVREMWFESHAYRFAVTELEEVVEEGVAVDARALGEEIWNKAGSERSSSADEWGPVANVHRFSPPSTEDGELTDLLESRLGPFVRGLQAADI